MYHSIFGIPAPPLSLVPGKGYQPCKYGTEAHSSESCGLCTQGMPRKALLVLDAQSTLAVVRVTLLVLILRQRKDCSHSLAVVRVTLLVLILRRLKDCTCCQYSRLPDPHLDHLQVVLMGQQALVGNSCSPCIRNHWEEDCWSAYLQWCACK